MITSFSNEFSFLSNFFPCTICFEGQEFPSVEHAFQAAKTLSPEERETISNAPTPGKAKRLGKKITLREDWEDKKLNVMEVLVRQKFLDPILREKLLTTKDEFLVEGNHWGDTFWGATWDEENTSWVGKNHLGKIIMKLREEIS